ncbi:MAG: cardiolipin synthase ClsB [Betaproteobacteria bacterium]|nr:cardiolipin synthase ClsB [Betaproteobacteria bacterium]MDH5220346.1 cardiolipin synthase ClsB [Betaproteobacteria bacterium]MDH5349789.1 cardiolipin synthase ClsB [Betaproteobacteria bacterium]
MQYLDGNRLTLLRNGEQYFPALVGAIDGARDEVFLETYIFADDETGSLVTDALARAAARGVAVHLLIDGFGARDFAPRFRRVLREAGAQVLVFRPDISPWSLRRNRLRRMHRKLACVDGLVAFVGGINVIDDFDAPDDTTPRHDYAVRAEGPLAVQVRAAAAQLWVRVARTAGHGRVLLAAPPAPAPLVPGQRAVLVIRDSLRHRRDIEDAYLELIDAAREEILIASAYFFPGRRFRHALVSAARRGVRVVLLVQGLVEYVLPHYASRALYGSLLEAGIRIEEYHHSFLHAKVAVFDGCRASVGSSNIDPFSLLLAREANVFADDVGFSAELRASLEDAIRSGARTLPPLAWRRRPLWRRAWNWIAYGIGRLLINFASYERYH